MRHSTYAPLPPEILPDGSALPCFVNPATVKARRYLSSTPLVQFPNPTDRTTTRVEWNVSDVRKASWSSIPALQFNRPYFAST